jgi:hypothetical protein
MVRLDLHGCGLELKRIICDYEDHGWSISERRCGPDMFGLADQSIAVPRDVEPIGWGSAAGQASAGRRWMSSPHRAPVPGPAQPLGQRNARNGSAQKTVYIDVGDARPNSRLLGWR